MNTLFKNYEAYTEENANEILDMIDAKYRDGNALETAIKNGGYEHIRVYGAKSFVIVYSDPSDAGSAIVYLRVSSDNQGKNGYGLDRQYFKVMKHIEEYNSRIEKYALMEGYEEEYADKFQLHVSAICFDVGISGDNRSAILELDEHIPVKDYFKDIRPALHYALSHANKTNRIVVEDVDRLWREFVITACNIQQIIVRAQSDVIVQKDWNYTLWEKEPMRCFMNMMTSCLADFDKKNTVNKLNASKLQAVINGRDMTGSTHYGYVKNADKTLSICEEEAKVIREEIIGKLKCGYKVRHIVANLNNKGIPNHNGAKWDRQDVYRIFKISRLIYGYIDYGEIHKYHSHLRIVEPDDFLKSINMIYCKMQKEEKDED